LLKKCGLFVIKFKNEFSIKGIQDWFFF
jgi:hypothetical protein